MRPCLTPAPKIKQKKYVCYIDCRQTKHRGTLQLPGESRVCGQRKARPYLEPWFRKCKTVQTSVTCRQRIQNRLVEQEDLTSLYCSKEESSEKDMLMIELY